MKKLPAPDKEDLEDIAGLKEVDFVEYYASVSNLTGTEFAVLKTELDALFSESPRHLTLDQVSEIIGCNRQTVHRIHHKPAYIACKDKLFDIHVRDQAGRFWADLAKESSKGKVSATKIGLQMTGKHADLIQTKNVNVNTSVPAIGESLSLDKAIDRFIIMLGERGYSIEDIDARWVQLKASQAF